MSNADHSISCHITMNVDHADRYKAYPIVYSKVQRALLCLPRFMTPKRVVSTTDPLPINTPVHSGPVAHESDTEVVWPMGYGVWPTF